MSAPASRKSFLAKIAVLGVAAAAVPALFGKRPDGESSKAGRSGEERRNAAPNFPLTPDPRAVARDSAEV